jgi:hypothetical protein
VLDLSASPLALEGRLPWFPNQTGYQPAMTDRVEQPDQRATDEDVERPVEPAQTESTETRTPAGGEDPAGPM